MKMRMLLDNAEVVMLTTAIAERTINLKRAVKIKTPDAIIAATALEAEFTLITNNFADFKRVQGLTILNPYNL